MSVRNQLTWRHRLGGFQGSPVDFDLGVYDAPLAAINGLEPEFRALSDADLIDRARELAREARRGAERDSIRVPVFALAREAARRALGLWPFDEQVVAGLALDRGTIVEMQTGEGKTLAAVMPACLNALTGQGVHVLTFNDYLARRDAEWMAPIYRALDLSVEFVQQAMSPIERRRAYRADITYVTAKEAGFDHLRDLLALDPADVVHRPFHLAIVDEADSLMIDEARVPLVIAGSLGREASSAPQLAEIVAALTPGTDFTSDEYGRSVELTDAGYDRVEQALGCGSLHAESAGQLLSEVNCAVHARALLTRDVDYIVRDGRVEIVDEFTGRVVPDRHWPDGLQAALEAKEGVSRRPDGRILGSITLQHFLGRYARLAGMTVTALDAAAELHRMYGVGVTPIPTHRPVRRVDGPDVIYRRREAKESAVLAAIRRAHVVGRPVLVGTLTIEESERLAARLQEAGTACRVLNAKNDAAEASIVRSAGALGAVTISTNMAGRGTDIRLGGEDQRDHDRVAALGGLLVMGTNRHESRRVDLQLRGRAGRQGDPGETVFYVSLDDDLLVRYGIKDLIPNGLVPQDRDDVIEHPIVRREVARAQRIVEGQNLEIRRTLWRYAAIVEEQRRRVMERREALLFDVGEPPVRRLVTLGHLDRAWRDHLSFCADLREGIHLVSLGGQDPLTRFTTDIVKAFEQLDDTIDAGVADALAKIDAAGGRVDLDALGIRGPSSTWTYLVNDDPFRDQIGRLLTGPGRATIAIYAGVLFMPLLLLWGIVDRLKRRRTPRRTDLFKR